MSETTETTSTCPCPKSVIVPITGLSLNMDKSAFPSGGLSREEVGHMIEEALQGSGVARQWQSDWFMIAANGSYSLDHGLGLEFPDKADVRLIGRVKTAASGWQAGDIIFADGCNYVGASGSLEIGWAISLSANTAHVACGNDTGFIKNGKQGGFANLPKANVECRLIIDY